MNKTLLFCLAIALWLPCSPALAADTSEPVEVGNTTMPPGNYVLIHKATSKTYTLMVTGKGNMILSAEPTHAAPAAHTTAAPHAATPAAAATGATPVPAATPATASAPVSSAAKKLMQKGVEQGMSQLLKSGTTKQLQNLIK